jgi:hypothetical protein
VAEALIEIEDIVEFPLLSSSPSRGVSTNTAGFAEATTRTTSSILRASTTLHF